MVLDTIASSFNVYPLYADYKKCQVVYLGFMAGVHGLEPRLTESKSAVLPLDDTPTGAAGRGRTDDLHVGNVTLYH